eukprot:TRINITY_DN103795_c0_g1_i1.p1 TRINITY_DN103795_c0_g1~~TRINITY_DN103795_c0_g1_i1.p1  ORF type:complete len:263 (-),score=40.46 TRINITY_DN103795_c0_g1_i1:135-923(-)
MAGGSRARSAASQALPSVASAYPLRGAPSLTSAARQSADESWQATLRERLGTPGKPPGKELLPSLYDPDRQRHAATGLSRSAPPSTVGPSASIVAWYAQFQCEHCGKVPMALDARYCASCGQALTVPVPSAAALAGAAGDPAAAPAGRSASQVGMNAAASEAMAEARKAAMPRSRSHTGIRGPDVRQQTPAGARLATGARGAAEAPAQVTGRPPRPPPGHPHPASELKRSSVAAGGDSKKPISFGVRESQVAVWLGNIKPRR